MLSKSSIIVKSQGTRYLPYSVAGSLVRTIPL